MLGRSLLELVFLVVKAYIFDNSIMTIMHVTLVLQHIDDYDLTYIFT